MRSKLAFSVRCVAPSNRAPAIGTLLLALASIALISGCAAAQANRLLRAARWVRQPVPHNLPMPRELDKTVMPAFVLQPGDQVLIEPVSSESSLELPGEQAIQPDGTVDLSKYGRLMAAGKTVEELELAVLAAIKAGHGPDDEINVQLTAAQSAVYYVLGEVEPPGAYGLLGHETVLDALLNAGGLSERASQCGILLVRPSPPHGCRAVLPVCYRQITQLGDTTTNYQVMPGDRIFVAEKGCLNRHCKFCEYAECGCPPGEAPISLPVYSPPQLADEALGHDMPEVVAPPQGELTAPSARKPAGQKTKKR